MTIDELASKILQEENYATAKAFTLLIGRALAERGIVPIIRKTEETEQLEPDASDYIIRKKYGVTIDGLDCSEHDKDIISICQGAVEICRAMIERGIEPENVEAYIAFEDKCVQKGFTIKGLLEAGEKQTAKKPTRIDYKKYANLVNNAISLRGAYWCPRCKHVVKSGAFCSDCGQKLDWSDERKEDEE